MKLLIRAYLKVWRIQSVVSAMLIKTASSDDRALATHVIPQNCCENAAVVIEVTQD